MPSARIDRLFMVTETRSEDSASSGEQVRLFFDQTEVCRFDPPAPSGRTAMSERAVSIPYSDLTDADEVWVGLTGADAWSPRSILVWARLTHPGLGGQSGWPWTCQFAPLAYLPMLWGATWTPPPEEIPWVSQDLQLGSDRLRLTSLGHMEDWAQVDQVFVLLETSPTDLELGPAVAEALQQSPQSFLFNNLIGEIEHNLGDLEVKPTLPVSPGSSGPIDVLITTRPWDAGGVLLHTELATRGLQTPASPGGVYLSAHRPTGRVPAHRWDHFTIRNRSDDPWLLKRVFVFGLDEWGTGGRVLFWQPWASWLGQDPFVTEGLRPLESLHAWGAEYSVLELP